MTPHGALAQLAQRLLAKLVAAQRLARVRRHRREHVGDVKIDGARRDGRGESVDSWALHPVELERLLGMFFDWIGEGEKRQVINLRVGLYIIYIIILSTLLCTYQY